jgi:hypothetical protein
MQGNPQVSRPRDWHNLMDSLTVYDGDESDIIAWPGDIRGRNINWRMTPERARQVAQALLYASQTGVFRWEAEVDALREAARRIQDMHRGSPPNRTANPLPRRPVDTTLLPDANRNTPPE